LSWSVDRTILTTTSSAILGEIGINFATSYQHLYILGLKFGETGVSARLQPAGVDLALLAFALGNLYLARHGARHWFVWFALIFGLAGTLVANGAYGAHWSYTGMLLSAWAPALLFMTVETGMILLKVAAEKTRKAASEETTTDQSIDELVAQAVEAAVTARNQARGRKAADTRKQRQAAAVEPESTESVAAIEAAGSDPEGRDFNEYMESVFGPSELHSDSAPKAETPQLQGIGLSAAR
jgi:uncharacterized protein DUF2637